MDPKMPKAVKPKRRKKSQSRTEGMCIIIMFDQHHILISK